MLHNFIKNIFDIRNFTNTKKKKNCFKMKYLKALKITAN